jgi:electron transport complex protein RnfD
MQFSTSPAPHTIAPTSVARVMRRVLYALAPAAALNVWFFGWGLVIHALLAAVTALIVEATALQLRGQSLRLFLSDGSAVLTAVLLAFCLPPLAPWWLPVIGTAFGLVFAKHVYGGLGFNVFNPAMAGYAMLLVSFPLRMTAWPPPAGTPGMESLGLLQAAATIFSGELPASMTWDAMTMATPLDTLRNALRLGQTLEEAQATAAFGSIAGRGWEWISFAALAGGVWMLWRGTIRWHIPFAMLAAMALLAGLMHAIDPGRYPGAAFHLLSGATMLGAFFIATDPVSAATSDRGRLIYGAGIGVLTYAIRTWGGYPDGAAFAVLLMNLAAPLIDHYTVPRIYGHTQRPRAL